jgi:uncharacterized membrane protein YraQ (UPF0718 family)
VKERTKLALMLSALGLLWLLPVQNQRLASALHESLRLAQWYAREHMLLCMVPAIFIAGAVSVFMGQGTVMQYLGPTARKVVAYPVAAASGTVLAVCSCTVLPLFASIHQRGAGLGPATAFLYSGPAINVLAIILTARVLGLELGAARAVGAVLFAVVIGLTMQILFRKEEAQRSSAAVVLPDHVANRSPWQDAVYFGSLVGVVVFANWGRPGAGVDGLWATVYSARWMIAGAFALALCVTVPLWFSRDELASWVDSSWTFAKQILPLLLIGVLAAGLLLGGPGGVDRGLIPNSWVKNLVGGDSVAANLFASLAGALMYFATLTEVPIVEGLLASGMGKGPALALLLAGPALSLPNMLVIRSVLGNKKTSAYVLLVVTMSTIAGLCYGALP